MSNEDSTDITSSSIEVCKGSELTTPDYYKKFLNENVTEISSALKGSNVVKLEGILRALNDILPQNVSFKEIISLICRRKNGNVVVSTAEGDFDLIGRKKTLELVDDLVQRMPDDIEHVLFLHTHPPELCAFGTVFSYRAEFSELDKSFIGMLGSKFKIFDLFDAFIGLSTANSSKTILKKGTNLGRAFGWTFFEPTI